MFLSASFVLALSVGIETANYSVKPDQSIAASAAAIAAERIGEIRGTITFSEVENAVPTETFENKSLKKNARPKADSLPPVSSSDDKTMIDRTSTGSILPVPIEPAKGWDKFDADGNPVYD